MISGFSVLVCQAVDFLLVPTPACPAQKDSCIDLIGPHESQASFLSIFAGYIMGATKPADLVMVHYITIVVGVSSRPSVECIRHFVQDKDSDSVSACEGMKKGGYL